MPRSPLVLKQHARNERAERRLAADLDQAWEHHRHLSEKNFKYVDRFMALALGASAFCAAIIDKDMPVRTFPVLMFALFVVWLFCLSITRSIVGNRQASWAYDWYFKKAFRYFYANQKDIPRIWKLRKRRPEKFSMGRFDSADFEVLTLYFVLFALAAAQLLLANEAANGGAPSWNNWLAWLLGATSAFTSLFSLGRFWHSKKQKKRSAGGKSTPPESQAASL